MHVQYNPFDDRVFLIIYNKSGVVKFLFFFNINELKRLKLLFQIIKKNLSFSQKLKHFKRIHKYIHTVTLKKKKKKHEFVFYMRHFY